jgi:hypothetical protein
LVGVGQLDFDLGARLLEEGVGHLQENPRAVARVGFTPARAAMIKIQENPQSLLNNIVRFPALDVDNKSHPARFMLESRVVQTLLRGQPDPRPAAAFLAQFDTALHSFRLQGCPCKTGKISIVFTRTIRLCNHFIQLF